MTKHGDQNDPQNVTCIEDRAVMGSPNHHLIN